MNFKECTSSGNSNAFQVTFQISVDLYGFVVFNMNQTLNKIDSVSV